MFSVFAFILLLNGVLALPSPIRITDSFVSRSDISRTSASQAREATNLKARQTLIETNFIIPMNCTINNCVTSVGVGNPPQYFNLLVDTGSSNTWIGAGKSFVPTSSTVQTGQKVAQTYGAGSFSGNEVNETLFLGPSIMIKSQGIGIANESTGFEGIDGILGIGPRDLTRGTLLPDSNAEIPTVVDSMKAQGVINSATVGIFIPPAGESQTVKGEIMFGGTDATKTTGDIQLFPTTTSTVGNAEDFWAVEADITLGSTPILSNATITMDTGTSFFALSAAAFKAYKNATGATVDLATGILKISADQFASLPDLTIHVLGTEISIPPEGQTSPFKDASTDVFLSATSLTSTSPDFGALLGMSILSRLYTAYDSDGLVGIAPNIQINSNVH